MIYAVISDIHANLAALRKVLDDAKSRGAERIVCLGDVVGYGPLPSEVVDLLVSENAVVVAGNHDDAVSGRAGEDDFIDLAREAVLRHREALNAKARGYLSSCPYTVSFAEAIAAHGDFTEPEKFNYIENEEDAAINFSAMVSRIAFVGHTHVPGIFLTGKSGAVYGIEPQDFTIEDDKRYIVNPGSVGYPRERNGRCLSSYVLYDSEERSVTFRFLPFAVSSVMQRGKNSRRGGIRLIAVLAAALCVAASLTWYLVPGGIPPVAVAAFAGEGDTATVEERILEMKPGVRSFRANIELDSRKGSSPATVQVVFLDRDGNAISEVLKTVKLSWTAKEEINASIREKAKSVRIAVKRQKSGDEIIIRKFAPEVLTGG